MRENFKMLMSPRLFVLLTIITISSMSWPAAGKLEGFVVGGRYAKIEDFPHSAYLSISCVKMVREDFACGASIINQVMLLTAAHCFEDCLAGSSVTVLVGNANRHRQMAHKVSSFACHARYSPSEMTNDIAVAKLTTPLTFSDNVKRVLLNRAEIHNERAMVAGWGITDEDRGTDTVYLKYASQMVWSRQKCLSKLPYMTRGFICAAADGNQDSGYASIGDSGSALVFKGSYQIGLVSHKISAISHSIIVYTSVPLYYDWIANTAKLLYCQ